MARCVIVSAGPVSPAQAGLVCPGDTVIACDAGWKNCEKLGLAPNLVLGDFDSAPQPAGAQGLIVLPHVKDDTDTHYAARQAVQMGTHSRTGSSTALPQPWQTPLTERCIPLPFQTRNWKRATVTSQSIS